MVDKVLDSVRVGLVGRMGDDELDVFVADFCVVVRGLGLWRGGVIDEQDYVGLVDVFKRKWFWNAERDFVGRLVRWVSVVVKFVKEA